VIGAAAILPKNVLLFAVYGITVTVLDCTPQVRHDNSVQHRRRNVGGVRNLIETHTSGGALFANITPNTHMMSYQTSEEKLAGVYITEKVDRKTGWQYVCIEEEWTRGYIQEIQDFMECVATGRQSLSDLALAFETIRVNYAGYWAAEEGRRVVL
jgi:predicted dehydrogenase